MKTFFLIIAVAAVGLPILAPFGNRRVARRLFWAGLFVATVSMFLSAYPPDWKSGILRGLLPVVIMLLNAYFNSSNLKFGGKIFAFNLRDSQPDSLPDQPSGTDPDSDQDQDQDPAPSSYSGMATAKKTWWLLVFVMFICTFSVIIRSPDKPWLAPLMAIAAIATAALFGYGDASWGYPVARGQRIQFVVVSVITAGVFAVLYLVGYRLGTRRPLRRKQSMEYRAHPHLREKYPQDP